MMIKPRQARRVSVQQSTLQELEDICKASHDQLHTIRGFICTYSVVVTLKIELCIEAGCNREMIDNILNKYDRRPPITNE